MEQKNILLIVIAVLVIALIAVGAYIITSDSNNQVTDVANATNKNTTDVVMLDKDGKVNNTTGNSSNKTNTTYRVYNPQTDSYVTVIGEGYDAEVDRWYTYDTDGVRYYNTRIK